jgi:hypothetical protein
MAGQKFYNAMTTKDMRTENNMPTHSTSGTACLDLFFKIGGSRQVSEDQILTWFISAYGDNPLTATKIVFYNRDIRNGQGERRSARLMLRWLAINQPSVFLKNITLIPEYGRWDDVLFAVDNTPVESQGFAFCFKALEEGDKLCGKWMPREGKSQDKLAKKLMEFAHLTPRQYRLLLAKNTKVVETLMCAQLWSEINYSHVPSMAMKKYDKAFGRHDNERFVNWLQKVLKGDKDVKINAGAIFPNDVIAPVLRSYGSDYNEDRITAQWNALPDYFNGNGNILPISDVSGSMHGQPMEVSIALGMYCAERNKGGFKNILCTFSQNPSFFYLNPNQTIVQKIRGIAGMNWGMNTNLEAVFQLILKHGVDNKLTEAEMPGTILIISDMQFDQCIKKPKNNAFEMIRRMYRKNNYNLPQIVFWNVRTSSGVPVKFDEDGTALVSGYSPSILTNILSGELRPDKIMEKTLAKYSDVRI